MQPPEKIELNLESLRQFSQVADFDFDAVVSFLLCAHTYVYTHTE